MPETNGSNKFITFKVLVSILVTILLATVGLVVSDTRTGIDRAVSKIECLERDKLDKDQYYRDMSDIKGTLIRMDGKLDRIEARRK